MSDDEDYGRLEVELPTSEELEELFSEKESYIERENRDINDAELMEFEDISVYMPYELLVEVIQASSIKDIALALLISDSESQLAILRTFEPGSAAALVTKLDQGTDVKLAACEQAQARLLEIARTILAEAQKDSD